MGVGSDEAGVAFCLEQVACEAVFGIEITGVGGLEVLQAF